MARSGQNREKTMQFRISISERDLINRAAASKQTRDSVYARRSIIRQAEMDLADKTNYAVQEEEMKAFLDALDKSAVSKPKLRKLLSEKTILE